MLGEMGGVPVGEMEGVMEGDMVGEMEGHLEGEMEGEIEGEMEGEAGKWGEEGVGDEGLDFFTTLPPTRKDNLRLVKREMGGEGAGAPGERSPDGSSREERGDW